MRILVSGAPSARRFLQLLIFSIVLLVECAGLARASDAAENRVKGKEEILIAENLIGLSPFWCYGSELLVYKKKSHGLYYYKPETGKSTFVAKGDYIDAYACTPDGWILYDNQVDKKRGLWKYEIATGKKLKLSVPDSERAMEEADEKRIFSFYNLGQRAVLVVSPPGEAAIEIQTQFAKISSWWFVDKQNRLYLNEYFDLASREGYKNRTLRCKADVEARKLSCEPLLGAEIDQMCTGYGLLSDEETVIFGGEGANCLKVMRIGTKDAYCITKPQPENHRVDYLAISQDGKRVAFEVWRRMPSGVSVADLYILSLEY